MLAFPRAKSSDTLADYAIVFIIIIWAAKAGFKVVLFLGEPAVF
jgi:hypothetical protein